MPKFSYYAKTKSGEPKKGYVTAISEDSAVTTLQSHGLIVIAVHNTTKKSILEGGEIKLFNRVPQIY
jgi:type II secretory pathway component PulF